MKRRGEETGDLVDVRTHLRDHYAYLVRTITEPDQPDGGSIVAASPWPRMVQAFESGASVVVSGWQIVTVFPAHTIEHHSNYSIEPDGTAQRLSSVAGVAAEALEI